MSLIPVKAKDVSGMKGTRSYLRSISELMDRVAGTGLVPPQALEIEQSILGAMMIDKSAANRIIEVIGERTFEDSPFYREAHTAIYRSIVNLDSIAETVDLLSVTQRMRLEGTLEEAGGPAYLVELTSKVVTTANVEAHARLVLEKFLARELIRSCEEAKLRAFLGEDDTFELLDSTSSKLFDLSAVRHKKGSISADIIQHEAIAYLEKIHDRNGLLSGVPSGLEDLDTLTTGWQKNDLIILAARPSHGKTALALTLARNAALSPVRELRVPVAIFSLEMGARALVVRLLCAQGEINSHYGKSGKFTAEDWRKLSAAAESLHNGEKIYIDDTPQITQLELRTKCRRLKQKHNIGLIIVDYLQLMDSSKKMDSREREIAYISRSLKAIAKELETPVIALSQLNRSLESRHDKRPMLSDLRESGAIEADADLVVFIYRPEVYGIEQFEGGKSTLGSAELIVAKQRDGPTGSAFTAYRGEYGRFDNLEQREFEYPT